MTVALFIDALYLWRASRPHAAIVGLVPGTQHFRNVLRHKAETAPNLLTLRIDESLAFINARWLEEKVLELVAEQPRLEHMVLMFSAVNEIDASALESLEAINHRLPDAGVRLHLSEVKGPVKDRLKRSSLLDELTCRVFLSQFDAFEELARPALRCGRAAACRHSLHVDGSRLAGNQPRVSGMGRKRTLRDDRHRGLYRSKGHGS
jgi:MFS superfamily sulfate permease-like transporter